MCFLSLFGNRTYTKSLRPKTGGTLAAQETSILSKANAHLDFAYANLKSEIAR